MSGNLLTIQTAESKSLKDLAKINLGRFISTVCSQRTKALTESPTSFPASLKDKLLMAYLKERARTANNTEFFERLHVDFWQGQGGEVFSANCDHRFQDLFLAKQAEDFQILRDRWSRGDYKHVVEVGCCAGLHLQHLTENLLGVESAVGIDINPVQIEANRNNPKFDSRISFEATDGCQWIIENGKSNTLFVTNGGVLEYFSEERLNELFNHVSTQLAPAMFFTVEPVAAGLALDDDSGSVPFGEELSFSHNYRRLFGSNGFHVAHQRHVDFESWRMMTTIAVSNK